MSGKVFEIEDYNGNTILAFRIDSNGEITDFHQADLADVDGDYIFDTDDPLYRVQCNYEQK